MFSKRFSFLIILVLLIFSLSKAKLYLQFGPCPSNIQVIPDFNINEYLGMWYEYAAYLGFLEMEKKCITAEFTQLADGKVGIKNIRIITRTGKISHVDGYAVAIDNAKFEVTTSTEHMFNTSTNYWVLNTDYSSYSVAYSCQSYNKFEHTTTVWILTRERKPSADVIEQAKQVLTQNGFSFNPLKKVNQIDCN